MQTVQETPTRTNTDAVIPQIQTINLQNLAADLTPAGYWMNLYNFIFNSDEKYERQDKKRAKSKRENFIYFAYLV